MVTVSWGQCEPALGQADAGAENTLFEQAAAQGQSIVAASGDSGAQDCNTGGTLPQTENGGLLSQRASRSVTGVGGTSLASLGPRPSETVWNSRGTPPVGGMIQPGAGGGGISPLLADAGRAVRCAPRPGGGSVNRRTAGGGLWRAELVLPRGA